MGFKSDSVLVFLLILIGAKAAEYFVSLEGDDDNSGTLQKPWRHVQRAVDAMHAGDTCTIREGRYFEEVTISGLQGTSEEPITIRSYPGEHVVFDGTVPIVSTWEKYKDSIYVTTIQEDIWQLFVDGEMQINARWPNAFWYDFSVFDYTKWAFSSAKSTYNEDAGTGVMVDNGTKGLADSGLNATGAIAILNIGSWLTWAGFVEEHVAGENNFTYNLHQATGRTDFIAEHSRYFLEDKLEFLDAPTEWFYDAKTRKLYLWIQSGDSPQNHEITGKVSTYSFTITNGSAWLALSELNFFSTTVWISGSDGNDVNNIQLQSLYFSYPSYSKRMLGSLAVPNTTTIYYNGLLTKYAGNFSVFNCTWEYADGQTMRYRGADGVFDNNLWHHNDFTCVGVGQLFHSEGVRDQFIHNTVHSNGPSIGFYPGAGNARDRQLGLPTGGDIRLNLFFDLKYLQNDGAHVQTGIAAQNGTVLEYNWCYDTMKYGLRFDRGTELNAPWGYNGTMRYNVVWSTRGMMIKGDDHSVHNNLAFNNSLYFDMAVYGYPGDGVKGENEHTVTSANIVQSGACSSERHPNCTYMIPGKFTNNAVGDVRAHLRDPVNLDYRPQPNSEYVIEGIGPYGKESMDHGGIYWIPGQQQRVASMPIPPNGTATAKCDADLMWLAGYGAVAHDVYLGTNQTAVATANTSSHEFLGEFKTPSNIVQPNELLPETLYYWRVDSITANGIKMESPGIFLNAGPVWQFKCQKNLSNVPK